MQSNERAVSVFREQAVFHPPAPASFGALSALVHTGGIARRHKVKPMFLMESKLQHEHRPDVGTLLAA